MVKNRVFGLYRPGDPEGPPGDTFFRWGSDFLVQTVPSVPDGTVWAKKSDPPLEKVSPGGPSGSPGLYRPKTRFLTIFDHFVRAKILTKNVKFFIPPSSLPLQFVFSLPLGPNMSKNSRETPRTYPKIILQSGIP